MRSPAILALLAAAAACGRAGPGARTVEMGSFRTTGVGAPAEPTVRPARLLPEVVDESHTHGSEPGGGVRVITSGLRVVAGEKGAIVAADDRFSQAPSITVALPERLGGGFLFVLGTNVWRADRWLGPAKPIVTMTTAVQAILPGLDRVYLRTQSSVVAIEGRTGQALDLGPWPATPHVGSYAAADGWRAAAITDLRGAVATFDAGATWRTLDLPIDPKHVVVSGDNLVIGGLENGRTEAWHELRADGSIARLAGAPRDAKAKLLPPPPTRSASTTFAQPPPTARTEARESPPAEEDLTLKTFGKRPLAAAIEDGWPLTDGTAVVARDGALAKIRVADGALVELVRDAFPLKPARCHPVSLTRKEATGAFGFVCGEPRGTTVIYTYDPFRGRLVELKRFDKPRVVTSSGNGALAVRGLCAEDAEPTPPPRPEPAKLERSKDEKDEPSSARGAKEPTNASPPRSEATPPPAPDPKDAREPPKNEVHPYCVLTHDNRWREVHVRGDVGGERIVVLADGRIVVLSPPQALGAPARITVLQTGAPATTVAVTFPKVASDVGRVLRLGLWLDGFEERRPGVVGGWIEAAGTMLGVEIALDGKATLGQYVRDAGLPFVSGKYGFGWTPSRRGYETVDGGMTWTSLDLPDPLLPAAKVERRACGPIGCVAGGWLRVGWGEKKHEPAPAPPAPQRPGGAGSPPLAVPSVQLACEPLASMPPQPPAPKPSVVTTPGLPQPRIRFGGGMSSPPVLGTFNGLSELPPFYAQSAPTLRDDERGINVEVRELTERYPNVGHVARIYGWGPKSGNWDSLGRWQVKWLSPFAGWNEVRASLPSAPPAMILDVTKAAPPSYGGGSGFSNTQLTPGDDPAHALLVTRRSVQNIFELEADRAAVEVRRADGEPFADVDGVVRAAGRWYLTTSAGTGATSAVTVIWKVEDGVARELVRVPRATGETTATGRARLARHSNGRAIGLVVEGQSTAERSTSTRWVLPIDLETGAVSEPELLGYVDLAGRTLEACTDDATGWTLDAPLSSQSGSPGASVHVKLAGGTSPLNGIQARLRLSPTRACIERLAGTYPDQSRERAASQLTRAGAPTRTPTLRSGEILVGVTSAQSRFPLKCSIASAR